MTVWHVGDLHFGHKTVAMTRGFFKHNGEIDVESHDMAVYQSLSERLSSGDTLRLYGDLSMDGDWRLALRMLQQLRKTHPKIRMELIYGNHDIIHPLHRHKPREVFEEYASVFDWMGERIFNKADYGRRVYFSHFPSLNGDDRHSDKFAVWQIPPHALNLENHPKQEDWVIHAHTHQHTMYNETRPNHLCVSWDVFRGPIHDNTLKKGILRQLGKNKLMTPVHWGAQEEHRALVQEILEQRKKRN